MFIPNKRATLSLRFRCLQYMSDYSSCLLQGYGVLPSAPTKLKASLIASRFAILDWRPPKVLADTIITYHLNTRRLGSGDEYSVVEKVNLISNETLLTPFL